MHVHELNPKKTLAVAIIFAVVIIIGFLTMKKPLLNYQMNVKQSVQQLQDKNAYFYPYQLPDFINHKDKNTVLIDIRNKFVYGQGHIPGSENISAVGLTEPENIDRLKEYKKNGITVVLYGQNQLQANGPWMLFREVGFDNIKVLLGGYDYYKAHKNDLAATKDDNSYVLGIPRCNYAEVAKSSGSVSQAKEGTKKPVIFHRRKKAAAVSGGC
jgi:3-mercaptopyruvate sulfurtransferase SseA